MDKKILWILGLLVLAFGVWLVTGWAMKRSGELPPIQVATSVEGNYLRNKDGLTLYYNLEDEDESGTLGASCDAQCEETWLPYLMPEDAPSGIEPSSDPLLSRLNLYQRADGRWQYAIGTTPLYTYIGDANPGEMNGASVAENWIIARP